MTKSSWAKLKEAMTQGLCYRLSTFEKDNQFILERLDEIDDIPTVNRKYVSGTKLWKLIRDENEFSYLEAIGKIYKYKDFWIVFDGKHSIMYQDVKV